MAGPALAALAAPRGAGAGPGAAPSASSAASSAAPPSAASAASRAAAARQQQQDPALARVLAQRPPAAAGEAEEDPVRAYLGVPRERAPSREDREARYASATKNHGASIDQEIEMLRRAKAGSRTGLGPRTSSSLPPRLHDGPAPMDIDDLDVTAASQAPSLSRVSRPRDMRRVEALNASADAKQALKVRLEKLALSTVPQDEEDALLEARVAYRKRVSSEPSLARWIRDGNRAHLKRAHEKVQHWHKTLAAPLPVKAEPSVDVDLTPEFSEDEEELYEDAMDKRDASRVLVQKFNVDLLAQQLWCLEGVQWLNDEVINFYLSLLRVRSLELVEAGTKPALACYFHLTLFYAKLTEGGQYGYSRVKRWTKRGFRKCDLFTQDIVFFPRNISNSHWTLCVAYMKEKRIEYFDSMAGSGRGCMTHVLRYLVDEYKDKQGGDLEASEWEFIDHGDAVPQQNNGSDCGVFLCTFCNYLSMGHALDFSAQDMPYMRKRIAVDIVKAASTYVLTNSAN